MYWRSREFTSARVGVVGFIRFLQLGGPRCRRVGLSSLRRANGSFWFACAHSGAPRGPLVHSGSRGFTRAFLNVAGFIRVGVGSFQFAWVPSGAPRDRRVHSGSFGFTRARLGVVGFIWVSVGLQGCT